MATILFPLGDYLWFYAGFLLFVLLILALDLGVFHRQAHEVSLREATGWSVVWITLALLFNFGFYFFARHVLADDPRLLAMPGFDPSVAARQAALEFLTGFVVEKSLAVDNIFIFVVVFNFFAIPARYQHRILFYGILGALLFRVIFIALGSVLLQIVWVSILFGIFLILTGAKILFSPDKPIDPSTNMLIRLLRRWLPVHPHLEGDKFWVKVGGRWMVTPLMVALLFIEICDIVFAVDSVPAIFALTKEPLIVLTSNVFAILGLRSLYFLLAGVIDKFHFLKYGLGLVLVFVGLKLAWLNEAFGGKFPITWSLGIITGLVGGSIACSLLWPASAANRK
ncbi:MAG: TerC/Alx family metal homeostasis membrane protein [Verrucomicrobia bacterium]|nr:TerC/Alx family metal homeostasis membrane protein [Verrucomicrobiota bacterium]